MMMLMMQLQGMQGHLWQCFSQKQKVVFVHQFIEAFLKKTKQNENEVIA